MQAWPPTYFVKRHKKAKHVKLLPIGHDQLRITVPYRFNLKELPQIIDENKHWILQQFAKYQPPQPIELPTEVFFPAINAQYKLIQLQCETKLRICERPDKEIVFMGDCTDIPLVQKLLLKWSECVAKKSLPIVLQQVSKEIGISFNAVTVRKQRTLWGSCTVDKHINLNYKLIFLPYHLLRHVLIHELCHTVHLNHSATFWELVAQHDANYRQHKKALHDAERDFPNWVLNSKYR